MADEFARYQQIPQYRQLNPDMTLERVQGDLSTGNGRTGCSPGSSASSSSFPCYGSGPRVGSKARAGRAVLVATGLLALEPIVGWWMVASGLSERVEVSQYRLAAHLLIATRDIWRAALGRRRHARAREPSGWAARFVALSGLIAILVFCQIGLGALVAGLRAGLTFNTWPLMDGRLIPEGLFIQSPWWRNLFEDVTTVQFQHRLLAYVVVALALWQAVAALRAAPAKRAGAPRPRRRRACALPGGAGDPRAVARRADLGGAAAPGVRDASVRHGGRPLARDHMGPRFFSIAARSAIVSPCRSARATAAMIRFLRLGE